VTAYVHPSALVETDVIGDECRIWHDVHIRHGAWIGNGVSIGKGAYIDTGVYIGERTKIQNYACIYRGVALGRCVFIGPHACFTNDLEPRAVGEWDVVETIVSDGASIGANATVVCGVKIGPYAMVGAGSVVTHDVPGFAKVVGNPAQIIGYVCECGRPLQKSLAVDAGGFCFRCERTVEGVDWTLVQAGG
jgi:UDP-2-acetamido-3-amino-2,3-dideoxy-glucuronate N-acetyltransferase